MTCVRLSEGVTTLCAPGPCGPGISRCACTNPVLHMSAPVRRGAVADARLGLA